MIALAILAGIAPLALVIGPISPSSLRSNGVVILAQNQSKSDHPIRTFRGTIIRNGDKYVVSEDAGEIWYHVDDQQTVGKFDGQKVKVTGMLDSTKNLIRSEY